MFILLLCLHHCVKQQRVNIPRVALWKQINMMRVQPTVSKNRAATIT